MCSQIMRLVSRHPLWHDTDGYCDSLHVSSDAGALSTWLYDKALSKMIFHKSFYKFARLNQHGYIILYIDPSPQPPLRISARAAVIQLVVERLSSLPHSGLVTP